MKDTVRPTDILSLDKQLLQKPVRQTTTVTAGCVDLRLMTQRQYG